MRSASRSRSSRPTAPRTTRPASTACPRSRMAQLRQQAFGNDLDAERLAGAERLAAGHFGHHRVSSARGPARVTGPAGAAPYADAMRIALINSGLGLLAAAAAPHRPRPDADLVLAMDPDGMPWGPRAPDDIAGRSLAAARAAAAFGPDAIVFACNTGTVHALGALRAEFEPAIPIVGTVPAIKPAAVRSH